MTPAARVQAAIDVLESWLAGEEGMDRVLTAWGRAHRFAGSGDRRRIADLVYDCVRRLRSAAWVAGCDESDARGLVRGSLMLDGAELAALFDGSRYGPPVLTDGEGVPRSLDTAPKNVRLDVPAWLEPELVDTADTVLAALRLRAPVDLRVNVLKADASTAIEALAEDGVVAEPLPLVSGALRVLDGARKVSATRAYREGKVEIQDAASQQAIAFARAEPGMTVLDLCAGGGGKTLGLGAFMNGNGRLIAHDIAPARMKDLPMRAARAGLEVELIDTTRLSELEGQCDLVVVDAPCSGSGIWRRNPDQKWRMTAADLERLEATQAALLDQAAGFCAVDGRLVYMTCSILARENALQIARLKDRNPEWRVHRELVLSPDQGTDGFYAAELERPLR